MAAPTSICICHQLHILRRIIRPSARRKSRGKVPTASAPPTTRIFSLCFGICNSTLFAIRSLRFLQQQSRFFHSIDSTPPSSEANLRRTRCSPTERFYLQFLLIACKKNCRLNSPPLQRLHSSTDQKQTIHQFPAAVHLTAHDGLIAHSEVPTGF